ELFVAVPALSGRCGQFAGRTKSIVLSEIVGTLVQCRIAHQVTDRTVPHQPRAVEIDSILETNQIGYRGRIEWACALTSTRTRRDRFEDGTQFGDRHSICSCARVLFDPRRAVASANKATEFFEDRIFIF